MPKVDELHATDLATFCYFFGLFPHKSSKPLIGILSAMVIIHFFGEIFSHFDQLQLLGLRLCSSAHALPLFCTDVRNPRSKESDGPTPSQHTHTTYIPIFHYSHLLTVRLSSSVVAEAVASRQNAITAASDDESAAAATALQEMKLESARALGHDDKALLPASYIYRQALIRPLRRQGHVM